jgi:hypothetical protein
MYHYVVILILKGISYMDTKSKELFWTAGLEEIKNGLIESDRDFKCIICEESFEKGRIYENESKLNDAGKAAEIHIKDKHGSMLEYLLNMNPAFTGLSEVQKQLLSLMAEGLSDKETAEKLGVAQSTIRNHRFKLREKEKQAKLFLSIMGLLSKNTDKKINNMDKDDLCDAHKTATTLDDRYNISDRERENIIKSYISENGGLKSYPVKEKKKIIVLSEIVKNFSSGKLYSEKEINRILKRIYEDYATIRRALVEYGFLDRTNDCSSYWLKE